MLPHGTSGIVPTHLPAKRLVLELGCCLAGFVADSPASDFCFGLGVSFGFGFAVDATVGAGVGLS
jgi:hypothetical protein